MGRVDVGISLFSSANESAIHLSTTRAMTMTTANGVNESYNTSTMAFRPSTPDPVFGRYPPPAFAAVACVFAVLIVWTAAGNFTVLLALMKYRHLRTISNLLIGNLALSDFLLAISVVPFSGTNDLLAHWVFGALWCRVWLAIDVLYCTASIWNVCAIALDRYTATRFPLWYSRCRSEKTAALYICVVWLTGFTISIPPILFSAVTSDFQTYLLEPIAGTYTCELYKQQWYVIFSATGSFVLPMLLLSALYSQIFCALRRQGQMLRSNNRKDRRQMSVVSGISEATATTPNGPGPQQRVFGGLGGMGGLPSAPATCPTPKKSAFKTVQQHLQQNSTPGTVLMVTPNAKRTSVDCTSIDSADSNDLMQQISNSTLQQQLSAASCSSKKTDAIAAERPQSLERCVNCKQFELNQIVEEAGDEAAYDCQQQLGPGGALCTGTSSTGGTLTQNSSAMASPYRPGAQVAAEVSRFRRFRDFASYRLRSFSIDSDASAQTLGTRFSVRVGSIIRNSKRGNSQLSRQSGGAAASNGHGGRFGSVAGSVSGGKRESVQFSEPLCLDGGGGGNGVGAPPAGRQKRSGSLKKFERRQREATRRVTIVVAVFVACWMPFMIMYVTRAFVPSFETQIPLLVTNIIILLGYVNSGLNPILYSTLNPEFRRAFQKILYGAVGLKAPHRRVPHALSVRNAALNRASADGGDAFCSGAGAGTSGAPDTGHSSGRSPLHPLPNNQAAGLGLSSSSYGAGGYHSQSQSMSQQSQSNAPDSGSGGDSDTQSVNSNPNAHRQTQNAPPHISPMASNGQQEREWRASNESNRTPIQATRTQKSAAASAAAASAGQTAERKTPSASAAASTVSYAPQKAIGFRCTPPIRIPPASAASASASASAAASNVLLPYDQLRAADALAKRDVSPHISASTTSSAPLPLCLSADQRDRRSAPQLQLQPQPQPHTALHSSRSALGIVNAQQQQQQQQRLQNNNCIINDTTATATATLTATDAFGVDFAPSDSPGAGERVRLLPAASSSCAAPAHESASGSGTGTGTGTRSGSEEEEEESDPERVVFMDRSRAGGDDEFIELTLPVHFV